MKEVHHPNHASEHGKSADHGKSDAAAKQDTRPEVSQAPAQVAPVPIPAEAKPPVTAPQPIPGTVQEGLRNYRVVSDRFVYHGATYTKGQTLTLNAKDAAQIGSSIAPA